MTDLIKLLTNPDVSGSLGWPHPNFRAFVHFNKALIIPLLEEGDDVETAVLAALARLENSADGKRWNISAFRCTRTKVEDQPTKVHMHQTSKKPGRATYVNSFAFQFRDSGLSPERWLESEEGKRSGLTARTLYNAVCKYIPDGNRLWCVRSGSLTRAQKEAAASAAVEDFLVSSLTVQEYCDGSRREVHGFVSLLRRKGVDESVIRERGYRARPRKSSVGSSPAEETLQETEEDENLQPPIENLDGYEFPDPEEDPIPEEVEAKTVADRCNDLASKEIELLGEKARKFDLIKCLILKREEILDQLKEVDEEIRQLL